jgi:hypothetical protein
MIENCKVNDCQKRLLVVALEEALCELSACSIQLNCRSGGSVVRAIESARQALELVGSPKQQEQS